MCRREQRISVQLNLSDPDREAHFGLLEKERERIEAELGGPLEWLAKNFQVRLTFSEEASLHEENDWPRQHDWLAETLEKFDRVFRPLVRDLDASGWVPDDIDDGDE